MASYDKKTKTWRGELMLKGHRYRKRGFLSKNSALVWEGQQRYNHERRSLNLPILEDIEIKEIVEAYIKRSQRYDKETTLHTKRVHLGLWLEFFSDNNLRFCRSLKKDTWTKFAEWRSIQFTPRGQHPANSSINQALAKIKAVFAWGIKEGLVETNPFLDAKSLPVKPLGVPKYLTQEQIKSLLTFISGGRHKGNYLIFYTLLKTGMRANELCTLEARDLRVEENKIVLRPECTKGGYERVIPVSRDLIISLHEKSTSKYVFTTREGKRFYNSNLTRRLYTILAAAVKQEVFVLDEVKGVNVHTLRKTYISHMVMAGVDFAKIMAIVGHKDFSTMRRYMALSPSYIQEAGDILPF